MRESGPGKKREIGNRKGGPICESGDFEAQERGTICKTVRVRPR